MMTKNRIFKNCLAIIGLLSIAFMTGCEPSEPPKPPLKGTISSSKIKLQDNDITMTEAFLENGILEKMPTLNSKPGYKVVGWIDKSTKKNITFPCSESQLNIVEENNMGSYFDETGRLMTKTIKYAYWTAVWEPLPTVTFDSKGGSAIPTVNKDNLLATDIATPKKDGFIFVGWSLTDGGTPITYPFAITKNTTLYALWIEKIFTTNGLGTITGLKAGTALPADGALIIPEKIDNETIVIIGANAFKGNTGIKSISLPNTIISIGDEAFADCTANQNIDLSNTKITSIGAGSFVNNKAAKSIIFPTTLTSVGNGAFAFCKPSNGVIDFSKTSLKSLGISVFYQAGITSVLFPSTLETMGDSVFKECLSLAGTIDLSNTKVKEILFETFKFTNIKSVILPASLTTIGNLTFENCKSLTDVKLLGATPPAITGNIFEACPVLNSIKVPAGSANTYKNATNWSAFATKISE